MIFLVVGPSYCGKTHLMREWLLPTLMREPELVTPAAPARFRGALIDDPPSPKDPQGQYPGERYLDVAAWRAAEVKSRISCFDQADPRALLALALEKSNVVLLLDEIDSRLTSRRPLSPEAEVIVERGRHSGVALVGSTRRLHNVHPSLRANTQLAWYGNLSEPADRLYAAKMASVDEAQLVNIPPRVFLEHDRAQGQRCLITIADGRREVLEQFDQGAA